MWKNSWDFIGCFLHGSSDGTFKYFNPEKLLQHFVQLNGLSPVWFPSRFFTWCGKAPVIFGALQWLFPSWILWSSLQVSWSWEALATLYALEWLLSIVIPFMNSDVEKLLILPWFLSFLPAILCGEVAHSIALLDVAHYIRKTGSCPDLDRKTGNPAPLPIGYGSEDSKKV